MKIKFLYVYFSFFLAIGSLSSLTAQPLNEGLAPRELQDSNHQELNLNDDKTLLFDQESATRTTKDSVLQQAKTGQNLALPGKPKSDQDKSNKDENDALSFNFLYYIIQKFKISDLIDE